MTGGPLTAERYAGRRLAGTETLVICRSAAGNEWPLPYPARPGYRTPPERHRYDWGRTGAGPTALARAILIDAIGPEAAACDECNGTGRIVYVQDENGGHDVPFDQVDVDTVDPIDVGECVCEDGRRPLPVADFVTDRIENLDGDWWLSRREVLAWLVAEWSQPPAWLVKITATVDTGGRT
jgi:hypothetical protein